MPGVLDILTILHFREMREAAREVLPEEEYASAVEKVVRLCDELHRLEGGTRFETAKRAVALVAQRTSPDSAETVVTAAGALDWLERSDSPPTSESGVSNG